MRKTAIACAAACSAIISGTAAAATLSAGLYSSQATVASANSACAAAGLTKGANTVSSYNYPGAGKAGFLIYAVPGGGILQLCNKFPATPSTGLNGFSATPTCTINVSGQPPVVNKPTFAFTATTIDANSAIGQFTLSIPANSPIAPGCQATLNYTVVRTGK